MIFSLTPWLITVMLIKRPATHAQNAPGAPFSAVWNNYVDGLMCQMSGVQAVMVNNHVYFTGTELGDSISIPSLDAVPSPHLFSIALNESTTISSLPGHTDLRYSQMPNGTGSSYEDQNRMWNSNDALYTFNRSIINGTVDKNSMMTVLSFNPNRDVWTESVPTGQEFDLRLHSNSPHSILNIPQMWMSLFFNVKEYVAINYSHMPDENWTVQTYDFPSEPGDYPNFFSGDGANYFFIPVGQSGLVISMGGDGPTAGTLDQISVLDLYTHKRYLVEASGTIPSPQLYFCGWVTAASDNSSFSVVIYSSYGRNERESKLEKICQSKMPLIDDMILTKVDALSLPSFEWVLVRNRTRDDPFNFQDYSCHQLGKGRGFVFGGSSLAESGKHCGSLGFGIINLSTFEWEETYEPSRDDNLLLHESIYQVIGGNELGGATRTAPAAGWQHTSLAAIFGLLMAGLPTPVSPDSPSDPNTEVPRNSSHEPRTLSISSIAGAAVGGFVGLVLVVALIWWNLRGKRQKSRQLHAIGITNAELQDTSLRELEHPAQEMPSDKHLITTELPSEPRAYEMWAGRNSSSTDSSSERNIETNIEGNIESDV